MTRHGQLRMTMIERLQRIASLLVRFRLPIIILGGCCLVLLVLSVIEDPWLEDDRLLMPSLLGFCWALMLYSTGEIFQTLPEQATADTGWRRRLALRVRRLILSLLGLLMLVSTAALLVLSYQLLRVWL